MKNWRVAVEAVAAKGKKKHPSPRWDQADAPFCSECCHYNRGGNCTLWKHGDVYETCKPVVEAMVKLLDEIEKSV